MSDELKPCPFCGGKASIKITTPGSRYDAVFVMCDRCLTSSNNFHSQRNAIEFWNRRIHEGKDN